MTIDLDALLQDIDNAADAAAAADALSDAAWAIRGITNANTLSALCSLLDAAGWAAGVSWQRRRRILPCLGGEITDARARYACAKGRNTSTQHERVSR